MVKAANPSPNCTLNPRPVGRFAIFTRGFGGFGLLECTRVDCGQTVLYIQCVGENTRVTEK